MELYISELNSEMRCKSISHKIIVAAIGLYLMENERIRKIKEEIAELKAKWPAHSVPPSMWMKLEELEERLEQAEKRLNHNQ